MKRAQGQQAWLHGEVQTLRQWARQCWESSADSTATVLSRQQSAALWVQALRMAGATATAELRHWARWAAHAWEIQLLERRALEFVVRADQREQVRRWQTTYAAALREHAWLDSTQVMTRLTECIPSQAVRPILTDLYAATRVELELLADLRARGWPISDYSAEPSGPGAAEPQVYRAGDRGAEVEAAAAWSRAALARAPDTRIALVVPDLTERRASVVRQLRAVFGGAGQDGTLGPLLYVFDRNPGLPPAMAAALSVISALGGRAEFGAVSRWLRSPFFCRDDTELGRRAALELEARGCVDALLGLPADPARSSGIERLLERKAPDIAAQLAAGRACLGNPLAQRTPADWTQRWVRLLDLVGWPGQLAAWDERLAEAWDGCLRECAGLTPIVGSMRHDDVLQELMTLCRARVPASPLPPRGLVVLDRAGDLSPGYDAIWVTGMSRDGALGRPVSNPLLDPRLAAQRSRGTADLAAAVHRLAARCNRLILSWSSTAADARARPHALLTGLSPLAPFEPRAVMRARQPGRGNEPLEHIVDRPAPWSARRIPGGARALALQAQAPIRAYCEYRLGARSVPLPRWGLSESQRGLVIHRALEHLFGAAVPATPGAMTQAGWRQRITRALTDALMELFGEDLARYRRLFRLEREALRELVQTFVMQDFERSDRRVACLEREVELECAGHRLDLKIDRIDELSDGSWVVIDYKTGRAPTARDWFGSRLREPQLPAYMLAARAVGALTIALRPGHAEYVGVWPASAGFPAKPMGLPPGRAWEAQVAAWRDQIECLVREFAAGDARIVRTAPGFDRGFEAGLDQDPLLPLTRACEHGPAASAMTLSDDASTS